MRSLVEWRDLRLRAKDSDSVVHEREDTEVLKRWITKLDFGCKASAWPQPPA